jgi:GNAT superfamily N-acetyltransferase
VTGVARIHAVPANLDDLASAAAAEGFGMLRVLAAEWASGEQRFAAPGEALFAARNHAGSLIGIGGVTRDPWVTALRMRRFHVRPEARGGGVGRALAGAALDHARGAGAVLVRLRAPAAAAGFWVGLGFVPVMDPKATHSLRLRGGC